MLWNNLPYEEALAIYEMKLKEMLKLDYEDSIFGLTNDSDSSEDSGATDTKEDEA